MRDNSICKSCKNAGEDCPVFNEKADGSRRPQVFRDELTRCVCDCDAYQRKEDK